MVAASGGGTPGGETGEEGRFCPCGGHANSMAVRGSHFLVCLKAWEM